MKAKNPALLTLGVVLGIIFLLIAAVYFTHEARMLPHFFPGYTAGMAAKHTKHGLAAVALAVLAFVLAWFQTAPKPVSE